jgi:uncharacterized membrane protein (Fun14 family)
MRFHGEFRSLSTVIITSAAATVGGGFFGGLLFGFALKKVVKVFAVAVGLFMAGSAYRFYHLHSF